MNLLNGLAFLFLIIVIYCLLHRRNIGMKIVKSKVDNLEYRVRDSIGADKRADRLAHLNAKINKLLKILRTSHLQRPGVKRLLDNYDGVLQEIAIGETEVAYNENKGEKIAICLDMKDDENTTLFVVLHELAHGMTKNYSHNKQFWDNMSFLIEVSIDNDIYIYQDYEEMPEEFCNIDISSSPYSQ